MRVVHLDDGRSEIQLPDGTVIATRDAGVEEWTMTLDELSAAKLLCGSLPGATIERVDGRPCDGKTGELVEGEDVDG